MDIENIILEIEQHPSYHGGELEDALEVVEDVKDWCETTISAIQQDITMRDEECGDEDEDE